MRHDTHLNETYLIKTHRYVLNDGPVERFVRTDGYHLSYSTAPTAKPTGQLDLRNVTRLRWNTSRGVVFTVADRPKRKPDVAFAKPRDPDLLAIWCSAVPSSALGSELRPHRSEALAASLSESYGSQPLLSAKRSALHQLPAQPPPAAQSARSDALSDEGILMVRVPTDAEPGARLSVDTPGGSTAHLTVPEGAKRGAILYFDDAPASPALSSLPPSPTPATLAVPFGTREASLLTPSEESLAIPPPSSGQRRPGRMADLDDHLRTEWLAYSLLPTVCEYKRAASLCVDDAERAQVESARKEHDAARAQWVHYLVASGDEDGARELGWDGAPLPMAAGCIGHTPLAGLFVGRPPMPRPAKPDGEYDAAATTVQAHFRGRQARFELEERARLEWLEFYQKSDQFDKAHELCITDEEHTAVENLASAQLRTSAATKLQAASRGAMARDNAQERARRAWFEFYLSAGEIDKARPLALTAEELDRLEDTAKWLREPAFSRCLASLKCLPQVGSPSSDVGPSEPKHRHDADQTEQHFVAAAA